jgi:2-methylisocitrate lyase-like PEP mutase family enzyme
VVGAYTGLSDVGTATMTECVTIAGWIADSVSIPVIMDGDTGHGGIMAVRRMVRECIRAGIAGIRIDDQPIESKRATAEHWGRGRAARPGDCALPRRSRHEE